MTGPENRGRATVVAALVVLSMAVGGIALSGTVFGAENLHDGSMTHPSTGEPIHAVNSSEKKQITYGYVVDNVTDSGDTVELFLTFPNHINNSAGKLSSFGGNVTCVCGGAYESASVDSSATIVDGPDGDGRKETVRIATSPSKTDTPVDLVVNFTGYATFPAVDSNREVTVKGAVVEPNQDVSPTRADTITVVGGLYTETTGVSNVGDRSVAVHGNLWNTSGSSTARVGFTYWKQGAKGATSRTSGVQTVSDTGGYSADLTGLTPGTTYVVRTNASTGTESMTSVDTVTFTTTGEAPTPTPSPTATVNPDPISPTPTATATPTVTAPADSDDDGVPDGGEGSGDRDGDGTPNGADEDTDGDGGTTATPTDSDAGDDDQDDGAADSPTDGSGPGFGPTAALVALIGAALLALRRR